MAIVIAHEPALGAMMAEFTGAPTKYIMYR